MDSVAFNELRKKGKENGIEIFKVEEYSGENFVIHYFIEEEFKENDSFRCDNEKMLYGFKEKTIIVNFLTSFEDAITKIKLQNPKKPPLGIKPHFIWIEQRIDEILKAMDRYREAKKEIPQDWYIELAWLEKLREPAIEIFRDFMKKSLES